ncbi:nickel/cobalt ABC transporter permease [Paenibacillus sp. MMS18-CY102]|uniref:nickel/cobalt ABC transporter permease n=1 Tax=Paenibacillus sp. MMS18-CY102 TaxID=2682849 RepID=UPI001365BF73|nr:nickel/cobalt ABC transporter permease [Paenibacillus sp. MMS18-CY102]MWC28121.1 ABC transporter permease subunit [Paenibacillus sp. MMS18-CY102]
MGRHIIQRALLSIPLLLIISFLTFVFIQLTPTDPVEAVLHAQGVPAITDELRLETKSALGLDRPFMIRYLDWLAAILQLDFGNSYVTGKPIGPLLGPALLHTVKLTGISVIAIVALSIALGVICAMREGRMMDKSVRGVFFMLTSMPPYWISALLIWYFSVHLDLLPTSGMGSFRSYVLPVTVITISYAGIYFRVVRSAMLANLNEGYVLYGRASGLTERRITLHILRNSLQSAVSVFGMAIPVIVGSTVVVENLFAWPGLGTLSVNAILSRDFPMIQAYILVLAVGFVLFNAVSDMINALLNPKLREDR